MEKNNLSQEQLLELYGLYKQATIGDINIKCPSILNYVETQKWHSWNKNKEMTKINAMRKYITLSKKFLSIDLHQYDIKVVNINLDEILSIDKLNKLDNNTTYDFNDVVFIQYTPGSTNNPKGIIITHQNILSNLNYMHKTVSERGMRNLLT